MMPDSPPMMNIAMNPMANHIGVFRLIEPSHIVPIQLKIFTPVGMAMSIVARAKKESPSGPIPTVNMWWLHTPQPMNPMKIPE
jgi:hypothetical protein